MLFQPQAFLPPIVSAVVWFSSPSSIALSAAESSYPVDILEVIKVYGKLAGPSCYGKIAPRGSSCQITSSDLKEALFRADKSVSREEFGRRLAQSEFQWPLKPYGVEKSNDKTALMNKGAETRIFMEELQAAGLYDPRNPTGPLPTSLRPQLNARIQREGLQEGTIDRIYDALRFGSSEVTQAKLDELMVQKGGAIDYYGFLELLGPGAVSWR